MLDQERDNYGHFGPGYFFFGLFGIYLLILGILKEDMFLRIAIFGPILIAGAGIFLLMLTIDIRHGLSSALQSTISSFVPRMTYKERSRLLSFLLLFTGLNFAWISTIFLPKNAPSFFGIFLFCSAAVLPLFIGKTISKSSHLFSTDFIRSESVEEFQKVTNILLSDTREGLNSRQKSMIQEQKKRFRDHVFDLSNNDMVWKNTLERLALSKASSTRLRKEILKLFSKEEQEYFSFVVENSMEIKEAEMSTIEAEFLMDAISDVLLLVAREKEVGNGLKWQLGVLLCQYMSTYHSTKNTRLAMPLIQTSKTTEKKIRELTNQLYSRLLIEYADSDERNWDPWFVCTLQGRLMELNGALTVDEHKQILEIGKGTKKNKIAKLWFKSVLSFVEQLSDISSQNQVNMISSKKFTTLNAWPGLAQRNLSEEEFSSFSEPILSQLPLKRKTLVDQLLILMLILSSNF